MMTTVLRPQLGMLVAALMVATTILFAGNQGWLRPVRDVVGRVLAPAQGAASTVGDSTATWLAGWSDVGRLRVENENLRVQVQDLVRENIRLRAFDLENRDLREQLRYAESNPILALSGARIIGFDQSAMNGYATIDCGTEQGVADGMPVLSPAGLAGRVVSTTARTSSVLLVTHPSSSVNAYVLGATAATGIVNGTSDGQLVMRYLPPSEKIVPGSIVVTSGLGGAFPRNLPIGRVAQVEARDVDMFQQATVEPLVDFRRLLVVLVARGYRPIRY
jgi:rod shape-determining protein MreC